MSKVQELIIARFYAVFGDPKHTDNIPAFVAEYERSLGYYSAEVLRRAADKVIDEQVFKAWPVPGECRKAAEHVAQMIPKPAPSQAELDRRAEKWPAPSEESKEFVRRLTRQCVANLSGHGSLTETSKRMTGEAAE